MNGIINVNKTKGITSFDVIRRLRKLLNERAIGHTGTLDPLATGVMVVCVGGATKLVHEIESKEKTYIATFDFGYRTDTLDVTGEVLEKKEFLEPSKEEFIKICESFVGDIEQIPPMYSAIKIDGKKLYNLARKGIEVERKPRPVNISEIKVISFTGKNAIIKCTVSKGTYVRTLIDDIGTKLGTFATMTELLRQEVGEYHINKSFTLEDVEGLINKGDFSFLSKIEDVFAYDKITINDESLYKNLNNGNRVPWNGADGFYRVYFGDNFFGLANIENNYIKPYRYFNVKD